MGFWKTRESADSPPCNCRQLFSAMLRLKCSKPCVFHIFRLSKAFSKVHFVLRGPIQNSENKFSSRRNTQFFFHVGKKGGNLYFEVTCACWVKLMWVSSLLFNLATNISEVLLRWTRRWLHYAAIGSFAPIANGFRVQVLKNVRQRSMTYVCKCERTCDSVAWRMCASAWDYTAA